LASPVLAEVSPVVRPTGREEAWRFTPLERLGGLLDGLAADPTAIDVAMGLPAAVQVATDLTHTSRSDAPLDALAQHALALAPSTVLLTVPAEADLDAPLRVSLSGTDATAASHVHLVLDVRHHASAVLVLDHSGATQTAELLEVLVGDGAHVTVVSLHEQDRDAVLGATHAARVGRDATYRHVAVSLGGDLVRLVQHVSYVGPGGDAVLDGAFLTGAGQHHEHRLLVDHGRPSCRSRVTYKGALQGEGAHSVWVGDVLIRAEAVGTDTYETNRNLVLTEGARADSVPNLEIETGEVAGAGHASATGRFDEEQLFYLQARGIPADTARRLVVSGFFAGILDTVAAVDPALHERLTARVAELVQA